MAFLIAAALSLLAAFLPAGIAARPYMPPPAPNFRSSSAEGAAGMGGGAAAAGAEESAADCTEAAMAAATSAASLCASSNSALCSRLASACDCRLAWCSTIIVLKTRKSSAARSWLTTCDILGSPVISSTCLSKSSGRMSTSSMWAAIRSSTRTLNSLWISTYTCLFSSSKLSKRVHLSLMNSCNGSFQVGALMNSIIMSTSQDESPPLAAMALSRPPEAPSWQSRTNHDLGP
mmetsp:Transcript_78856/g.170440  ORF Transcript_78856/g.170440 Transcript_78856/m.170440 type:complete len:233 (+) Transcript_78856:108-806(+)